METTWLCLEFTKTVGWRGRDRPDDRLTDYAALVEWCHARDVVGAAAARDLLAAAEVRAAEARAVHERAVALREAVYGIFSAIGEDRAVDADDLALLNVELSAAHAHRRVEEDGGTFDWRWDDAAGRLDRPLWLVAQSAGALLTAGPLERVRRCAADDCGWLFVDASRNRSRRWCDMSDCGNRAKVRRYRERRRG